ncbi:DEAD/DEAH box helicase [Paenibacillus oryzisoli]|uniref:DEAD/DEAH box helicase n=1 Tax=Paenibacillus oryzisoli TaxID=1850517 RepID=UPI003D2E8F58
MSNGFALMGIQDSIVQTLQSQGITEPTPIQRQAIPVVMEGSDVIAQAQTGTGKTLAFVLPILEKINVQSPEVQALILTPTRELAIQISNELKLLAPVTGAGVLAAYGGQDVEKQLRKLQGNIHIVVGTPGRLLDHLRRGSVNFYKLKVLVLDEADQMLHMGFLQEVRDIILQTSSNRQTLLFSATMPGQIVNLSKAYMKDPKEIKVQSKQVTLAEIKQELITTTDKNKLNALLAAIKEHNPYLAMIFCKTKAKVMEVNEFLQVNGMKSDELHGDLSQSKREQVMKRFREGRVELLVATDIAARGLDVEGVTHVYNFDIPQDAESYIHRIGRTGRAGDTGVAVTFATTREIPAIELIEKGIKMSLRGEEQPQRKVRVSREEDYGSEGTGSARRGRGRSDRGTQERGTRGGGRSGAREVRRGGRGADAQYGAGRQAGTRVSTERSPDTWGRAPQAIEPAAGPAAGKGRVTRGRAEGAERAAEKARPRIDRRSGAGAGEGARTAGYERPTRGSSGGAASRGPQQYGSGASRSRSDERSPRSDAARGDAARGGASRGGGRSDDRGPRGGAARGDATRGGSPRGGRSGGKR